MTLSLTLTRAPNEAKPNPTYREAPLRFPVPVPEPSLHEMQGKEMQCGQNEPL